MKLILTDKALDETALGEEVRVQRVSLKGLGAFEHHTEVVAIAGSRAMAIKAAGMDLPSLKLFQLTSAGFDGVPCEAFAAKGVALANAGDVYSAPIAETVVFGMLLVAKRLRINPENRHFKLQRHYHLIGELKGKKALVLGAGNIGTAIASRLAGFEMTVDGYDIINKSKPPFGKIFCGKEALIAALGEYDYIISTLPDNEHTKGFIDSRCFQAMKSTAVVVNVGRKAVFDNEAFYRALKMGQIGTAVLDMFETIPNPLQNKFRRLKQVVVLPGVAAISQEVNERLRVHMTANIAACLSGKQIQNVINGVK